MKKIFASIFIFVSINAHADLKALISHPNQTGYYHSARCMGLFGSMIEWIGKEKMGSELYNSSISQLEILAQSGLVFAVSEQNISNIKDADKMLTADFKAITEMYVSRYRTNYANDGFAWQEDEIVKNDLVYCKSFTQTIASAIKQ